MKQNVSIRYNVGIPYMDSIELNLNLQGKEWPRELEVQVLEGLLNKFYKKAPSYKRGEAHTFFYRADGNAEQQKKFMVVQSGDQAVPQDVLDVAAQEIFDNIIATIETGPLVEAKLWLL